MATPSKSRIERTASLRLALVMLLGFAAGAALFLSAMRGPSAAHVSALTNLITQEGKSFDATTLRGRYALIYFGFTYCPDACPTALYSMAAALKAKAPSLLQPIFVSVDPQRDTPGVVAGYLAHFGTSIIGLTGKPEDVQRVLHSFGVIAVEQRDAKFPGGYTIDHSNEFVLMSPKGELLQRIPGTTAAARLAEIVVRKMQEGG